MIADGSLLIALVDTSRWSQWFEPTGTVLIAVTLVVLCIVAWAANLIALPGNWLAVAVR